MWNANKIKIVWLCHFTNAEMQSHLPLWKSTNEFAPWIPNLVKGIEGCNDIELHVISPHNYLKRQTSFTQDNIHYHFIPYGIPLYHRNWPGIFSYDVYTDFATFRSKVKKLVSEIKPDLINLIGAENSYYSSSILDFKGKYPVLITIQGFISEFKDIIELTPLVKSKINIEEKILKEFKYYCGEQDSSRYISSYNPNHRFFRLYFPVNQCLVNAIDSQDKQYDCIFLGRIVKEKGIEDFIKVIAGLKLKKPDIMACVVGPGDTAPYQKLANELKCMQNIEFAGFLETQRDLFMKLKSSKVFLVPTHKERLASTIREAMYLKVPIVAYATGGIPYINEFDENIYMVKTGDYKAMAEKTLQLLNDETARNDLAEKAYHYAISEYSLAANTERLIAAYKEILEKKD